ASMRLPGPTVRVDTHFDATIGDVEMVREHIDRVVCNLVDNALYAMSEKARDAGPAYAPVLTLRTVDGTDHVDVHVADNGVGIIPEIADKIYNPFFPTKKSGEGTGLGLSLAHAIVAQGHQGRISMRTTPGQGTEFTITLPRTPPGRS